MKLTTQFSSHRSPSFTEARPTSNRRQEHKPYALMMVIAVSAAIVGAMSTRPHGLSVLVIGLTLILALLSLGTRHGVLSKPALLVCPLIIVPLHPLWATAALVVALIEGMRRRIFDPLEPAVILGVPLCAYLLIGGPNVSSYRGTVDPRVLTLILGHAVVMLTSATLVVDWRAIRRKSHSSVLNDNLDLTPSVDSGVILIAFLPGLVGWSALVASGNFALISPSRRFGASPVSMVLLETLLVGLALYCLRAFAQGQLRLHDWFVLLGTLVLLASSGYRGLVLIALALIFYSAISFRAARSVVRAVLLVTLLGLIVIAGFENIRRLPVTGGLSLSPGQAATVYQAEGLPPLLRQAHFAARESIAVTGILMASETTALPSESLLLADFKTVLPGTRPSGGTIVGNYVGRSQTGGITPGAVGASRLDLGEASWALFAAIGLLAGFLWRVAQRTPIWGLVYAIVMLYVLHFMIRGIPKIAYIGIPIALSSAIMFQRLAERRRIC